MAIREGQSGTQRVIGLGWQGGSGVCGCELRISPDEGSKKPSDEEIGGFARSWISPDKAEINPEKAAINPMNGRYVTWIM